MSKTQGNITPIGEQHRRAQAEIREWDRVEAEHAKWCHCHPPLHSGRWYRGDVVYEQCDRCDRSIRRSALSPVVQKLLAG